MKRSRAVAVLDTVSLINLLERVASRDLMEQLCALGFSFHVVESVHQEYMGKPREPGLGRLQAHITAGRMKIIPDSTIKPQFDLMAQWSTLGAGEIVSALYVLDHAEVLLVSDDKAAHNILKGTCGICCYWTTMLLDALVEAEKLSRDEAIGVYEEMKKNGFHGIQDYQPWGKEEK
jgi:hypothetical protein